LKEIIDKLDGLRSLFKVIVKKAALKELEKESAKTKKMGFHCSAEAGKPFFNAL